MKKALLLFLLINGFGAFSQNIFPSAGNVGIGTTSPGYLFNVNAQPGGYSIFGAFRMTGGVKNPGVFFGTDETSGISAIHFSGTSGYNGRLRVGNTDAISLNNDGSIGFGPGNPYNVGNMQILTNGSSPIANRLTYGTDNTGWKFAISKNFQGNLTDQIVIQDNGYVGIGTSSPTERLELGGGRPISFNSNLGNIKMKGDPGGWAMSYGFVGSNGTDFGGLWGYGGADALNQWSIGKLYTDEFFVVKSTGQIGIGTSLPSEKLELASNGDVGIRLFNKTANTWDIKNTNLGKLDFIRGGDKLYMRIDQSGNVGIGGDPVSKFNVNYSKEFNITNPSSFYGIHLIPTTTTQGHATGITFGSVDGQQSKSHAGIYVTSGGSFGTRMYFGTTDDYSVGSKTRMTISENGRVGIGTSTPNGLLSLFKENTVSRTSTTDLLFLGSSHSSVGFNGFGTSIVDFRGTYRNITPHAVNRISFLERGDSIDDLGGAITFSTKVLSSGNVEPTEKMRIEYNGNVGIGNINPAQKLDVSGNVRISGSIMRPDNAGIAMQLSNGTNTIYGNTVFYDIVGTNQRMLISETGNVGIGTTNPSLKLHVAGDLRLGGDYNTSSTLTFSPSQRIIWSVLNGQYASLAFDASEITFHKNTSGGVAIGNITIPTGYRLAVDGNMIAEKVKVKNSTAWPDFVFKKDYQLPSLSDIEKFVTKNSHLPEIPSAAEVEKEGQDLGEMNRLLLKKVEELTLYLIEQDKEIRELKLKNTEIQEIKTQLQELKNHIKK